MTGAFAHWFMVAAKFMCAVCGAAIGGAVVLAVCGTLVLLCADAIRFSPQIIERARSLRIHRRAESVQ